LPFVHGAPFRPRDLGRAEVLPHDWRDRAPQPREPYSLRAGTGVGPNYMNRTKGLSSLPGSSGHWTVLRLLRILVRSIHFEHAINRSLRAARDDVP